MTDYIAINRNSLSRKTHRSLCGLSGVLRLSLAVQSRLLKDKLDSLPDRPGVYMFKDSRGRIIYVGKAKSLRNRVRSYFFAGSDRRFQYDRLVAAICDVEVLLTRDEVEALRTEAAMIRHHQPRYNVDLKDDKSFPYLLITHEPFPRVFLTRKPHTVAGDYYGPYTDVKPTKRLLRNLKGSFQIRSCNLALTPEKIAQGRFKLCLDYHIGRCGGPCTGEVSQEQYRKGIDRFVRFLRGQHEEILADLEAEMRAFASRLEFEKAAAVRDRLMVTKRFSERQEKVPLRPFDRDAVNFVREDNYAAFSVIKVRGGRIVGQSPFHMERVVGLDDPSLLEAFLVRHYDLVDHLPKELLIPLSLPGVESLSSYLEQRAGHRVSVLTPKRGAKRRLVDLALTNAEHLLAERRLMADKRDFVPRSIKALQEHLHLGEPPLVIEAFDISNLQGTDNIAAMVVFRDGKPWKSGYRMFKIRSVDGIDDFASIGEAVFRRYRRLKGEIEAGDENPPEGDDRDRSTPRLPDLVLIDGGKGQLSRAKSVLADLGLDDLPVIGLAKRLEEIFLPGRSEPITLPRTSSALRLLQQVRDEAHRFAITHHRRLRGRRMVRSRLDDIPGVGPVRRRKLLNRFGSLKRIREADVEELAAVPGMNRTVAERILASLSAESAR